MPAFFQPPARFSRMNHYSEQKGREPTYFDRHIFKISFYHNMIFIKKRPN
jgi:hypothetical protein